jgi:hypothetical protein
MISTGPTTSAGLQPGLEATLERSAPRENPAKLAVMSATDL